MSSVIKIPGSKKLSLKTGTADKSLQEDKGEHIQQQLQFQYEAGYDQGYNTAMAELNSSTLKNSSKNMTMFLLFSTTLTKEPMNTIRFLTNWLLNLHLPLQKR